MTFTTLTYNGVEKALADWSITNPRRQAANQAKDYFAFDLLAAADTSPDPFPYGAQITIKIGRIGQIGPNGLPLAGQTSFSGGRTWFVGYRVETFRHGSPALEKLAYKFAGPWEFFFERLVFQKLWWTFNGAENVADWRSEVILGMSANAQVTPGATLPGESATCLLSIRQQLLEIIQYCVAQTTAAYGSPQLQSDANSSDVNAALYDFYPTSWTSDLDVTAINIPDLAPPFATAISAPSPYVDSRQVLRAPLHAANDITCADAIRYMLRWVGACGTPVVWFDYTQSPPMLRISTRDLLPAVNLPAVGSTETLRIKRRDDLIPAAIALKFRVTTTSNNSSFVQVIHDIAANVSGTPTEGFGLVGALSPIADVLETTPPLLPSGTITALQAAAQTFAAQSTTLDMEGGKYLIATLAGDTVYAGNPATSSPTATWLKAVFPALANVTDLANFDNTNSPITITDESGNPVNLATYPYRLRDGSGFAPWMIAASGAPGAAIRCTVKGTFSYTETIGSNSVTHKSVQGHTHNAQIVLTNLAPGVYETGTPGEIIPYGLAGYVFAIESIPQFEGNYTLVEPEITDQCPLGNNLNVIGSANAEWATMNACVQSIDYDLTYGRTTLTFGPPAHLGAKDLVERLRVNRGPRWYYQIGGNLVNASGNAGSQLSTNAPLHAPQPNQAANSTSVQPASLPDWNANSGAYTQGVPGITHDAAGAVAYGGLPAPNVPVIHLQTGGSGAVANFLRLVASGQIDLQLSQFNNAGDTTHGYVRIALTDLNGVAHQVFLREIPECDNISGTLTTGYRLYLCSDFYTTSIFG